MPLTWRQLKGQIEELPESALDQIALVDKFELYNEDWEGSKEELYEAYSEDDLIPTHIGYYECEGETIYILLTQNLDCGI